MANGSYNQTFTFFDLFRGRGNRQAPQDTQGFIFVEQSGITNSGEQVHVDNLLDEATTMSCITAIVQGITQIPIQVRQRLQDGVSEIVPNHPVVQLMKRPNNFQTASEFKSSIVTAMLTHGNAFIFIVRSSSGKPVQLYPLDPSDVTIGANALGFPTYTHEDNPEAGTKGRGIIEASEIIHIRDLTTFVPQGLSRALLAAEIIGAKKAADALMAETFRNGAHLNYIVSSDVPLDAAKLANLEEQMKKAFGQRGNRRGGAMFVEQGNVEAIKGLTPADVDLRDLRTQLIREIAAAFRVPSFMVGVEDGQTYNNVRQFWASFHRDTLQPIVTNIEEAITLKLLSGDEHLHFDIAELLKGDVETTARIAQQNVSNGIWTPNEARKSIGTKPYEGQDGLADMLIPPNSTTNLNLEETPENATGGGDGPQGQENVDNG